MIGTTASVMTVMLRIGRRQKVQRNDCRQQRTLRGLVEAEEGLLQGEHAQQQPRVLRPA